MRGFFTALVRRDPHRIALRTYLTLGVLLLLAGLGALDILLMIFAAVRGDGS